MKDIFIKKDYWYYLIKHCSENFNDWFDKDIFPKDEYKYLAEHCSENFNDWFDKDFHQKKVCLIDRILFRK